MIEQLLGGGSTAYTLFILSLVIAAGLTLGSFRVFGVHLGIAGVLFVGLFFGHFQVPIHKEVLEFIKEFGLIIFVYTIGIQVGPGFFSSLKKDGLALNLFAAGIVLLGCLLTLVLAKAGHIPSPVAVGLFSGATTNTPSLGAAQEALKELANMTNGAMNDPAIGYAIAYPFGVVGIILTMIFIRFIFRIDVSSEIKKYLATTVTKNLNIANLDIRVENKNLNGLFVHDIPFLKEGVCVISRIMHEGKVQAIMPGTKIFLGDVVHAVGPKEKLEEFLLIIGSESGIDLRQIQGPVTSRRVIVSKPQVAGKTLEDFDVVNRYGITVTRISRAGIEFLATPSFTLHLGDTLLVVGEESLIQSFASVVGDSAKALDHPFIIPVFVGIALGIIAGSIPFFVPGIPSAVKLGLAGGPLIAAIFLSWIGRIGRLVWYMPMSANFMLRELGIALFLACVGLSCGGKFLETLLIGDGFYWMLCGALITFVPIFLIGLFARIFYKINYLSLCGLLAGSMTDPPALAFANTLTESNAPAIAYSTVYPLVMILRVLCAQAMIILFF